MSQLDHSAAPKEYRPVTAAMLNAAAISCDPDRYPALKNAFKSFAVACSKSLQSLIKTGALIKLCRLTKTDVPVPLDPLKTSSLGTFLESQSGAPTGFFSFDAAAAYSLLNALLGYASHFAVKQNSGFTYIEKSLLSDAAAKIISSLCASFPCILAPQNNIFLSSCPESFIKAKSECEYLAANFTLEIAGHSGIFTIVLPFLDLIKTGQMRDADWQANLTRNLRTAKIDASARLAGKTIPLQEFLNLKVGSTIELDTTDDPVVFFGVGHKNLYSAKLGRKSGHIAIRIDKTLA